MRSFRERVTCATVRLFKLCARFFLVSGRSEAETLDRYLPPLPERRLESAVSPLPSYGYSAPILDATIFHCPASKNSRPNA